MFQGMNRGNFRAFGKPIVNITINDKKIEDWISFQVNWNGLGEVDDFEVEFQWDISNNPRHEFFYSGSKQSSVVVKGKVVVKIEAGFEGEEIVPLIEGEMDYPEWDFSDGETVKIVGRSYAAKPYDFVETVKYQNMTATEAFQKICKTHGLTPIVPVATSDMIGEYVNDDHTSVAEEMSHWDYVLYLAEQEGFVSRIKGKEWYFAPLSMLEDYQKEPLAFSYGHNVRKLKMKKAPNEARNFVVEVISWQSGEKKKKGNRIVEKAVIGKEEGENVYTIRRNIPNITRAQAQKHLKNICSELTKQQFSGSFETDFFQELTNDRRIVLYGVGMELSQIYHVESVTISGDKESGLECSVKFTNTIEQ